MTDDLERTSDDLLLAGIAVGKADADVVVSPPPDRCVPVRAAHERRGGAQRDARFESLDGDGQDDEGQLPIVQIDPMGDLARGERIAALRRAVLALPVRYREVVVLCDLEILVMTRQRSAFRGDQLHPHQHRPYRAAGRPVRPAVGLHDRGVGLHAVSGER